MKAKKYFFTYLPALLFIIFSQGAAAHMLFNYKTTEMQFQDEEAYQTENGNPAYIYLFENQTFQADISFITPDINFDLEELEVVTYEFVNPVVSVNTSGLLFEGSKIEGSQFWMEAWKIDDEIFTDWRLIINMTNDNLPNDTSLFAYIESSGNWDYATIGLHNYLYTRPEGEARLEVIADFAGEYHGENPNDLPGLPRFSVTHVSVPEPLTPMLLLSGLIGIFAARKIKAKIH